MCDVGLESCFQMKDLLLSGRGRGFGWQLMCVTLSAQGTGTVFRRTTQFLPSRMAAAESAPPLQLDDLPAEVLSRIVGHLTTAASLALRACSQRLAAVIPALVFQADAPLDLRRVAMRPVRSGDTVLGPQLLSWSQLGLALVPGDGAALLLLLQTAHQRGGPPGLALNLGSSSGISELSSLGDDLLRSAAMAESGLGPALRRAVVSGGIAALTLPAMPELSLPELLQLLGCGDRGPRHDDGLRGLRELALTRCLGPVFSVPSAAVTLAPLAGLTSLTVTQCPDLHCADPLSPLTALAQLRLVGCPRLAALDALAALDSLRRVEISDCPLVANVQPLARVPYLSLTGLRALVDVSALAGAAELDLSACASLADVSALHSVRSLSLAHCPKVQDISALGGVHTLNLQGCRGLDAASVAHLGAGTRLLNLSGVRGITQVANLASLHTLSLRGSRQLQDVAALAALHTLVLSECERVDDVSMLGGLHVLNLYRCVRVRDVSALGRVDTLILSGCVLVSDVSMLGGCRHLDLSLCPLVTDVSALGNVQRLRLSYCRGLRRDPATLAALKNVLRLDLTGLSA